MPIFAASFEPVFVAGRCSPFSAPLCSGFISGFGKTDTLVDGFGWLLYSISRLLPEKIERVMARPFITDRPPDMAEVSEERGDDGIESAALSLSRRMHLRLSVRGFQGARKAQSKLSRTHTAGGDTQRSST
jgi:hypothetical protein